MAENKYHTVVKGDTLYSIAKRYNTTTNELMRLNNLPNQTIVVGQKLLVSGTPTPVVPSNSSMAIVDRFGLQSNTSRTIYAQWKWDKKNTKHYQTNWYYDTGDGIWFIGNQSTTTSKQSTYNAPDNAKRVRFLVKPISETRTVGGEEVSYWVAKWSTEKIYYTEDAPPATPSSPTVELDKYILTATLDNVDVTINSIQFQVVKDNSTVFSTGTSEVVTSHASYSCTVEAGSKYKVRCRAKSDGGHFSDWSEYSDSIETIPSAPANITECRAASKTSIYIAWTAVSTAKTYDIQYTTKREYFDKTSQVTTVNNIEFTYHELVGLEIGHEYFFRVRAVNDQGGSSWSPIVSVILGRKPVAPTTWSSTTTVVVGEPLNLYWIHNAEDGSSQTRAELELDIDGVKETKTIINSTDEEEKDKTSVYTIDTTKYQEGVKIKWRVRTSGVTGEYGDWSVERTVDIYAPATLLMTVTNSKGELLETLESFPFKIKCTPGPNTQKPTGYYLSVTPNEAYETTDVTGNVKMVNKDSLVYSRYFDIDEPLSIDLSASDVDLENNISYTITCTVSMNSGLKATAKHIFSVAWIEEEYMPDAEIGLNSDIYATYIRPYVIRRGIEDKDKTIVLSIYRREVDGTFTKIVSDIPNGKDIFVTDLHPSLDYARYRVIAKSTLTGAISYYDVADYPVGGKGAVIQWDEQWTPFVDPDSDDAYDENPWSGSMLKLPYNLSVSDKNKPDVECINYIGRKHPVSYYGTHLGETSSWSVEVPKSDKETLYGLRRLQKWMGNVYVRESYGTGYWANVTVSFSLKFTEVTIPVTLNITRVEGGA